MTTVNSADKMQRLVSLKTTFVWTCMKGDLFFGLKFGVYYFGFHCKGVLISGGVLFFSGWGGGWWEVIGGILWVCNKTQL